MTRFTVTSTTPTGAIHTIECTSAWDAIETEDALNTNGYMNVTIISD